MKSITLFFILLLTLCPTCPAFAGTTNTVLLQIAANLQPALAILQPPPTFDYPDANETNLTLLIRFPTSTNFTESQSVPVSSIASTNQSSEVGPETNGFFLKIQLERLGEGNSVATPKTIQSAHWQTFYNCTPIGGTTNQIFWTLSSGEQMDSTVIETIKQNLWQQGFVRSPANAASRVLSIPAPVNLQVK